MKWQIIYASTSGNTEFVVEHVAEVFRQKGHEAELHRAEQTTAEIFNDNNDFIFATSTWEHGVINPFFNKLLKEMKDRDFSGKKAGFIGCGDIRYERFLFCKGLDKIHNLWEKNGGQTVGTHLKINNEPYEQMDIVTVWAERILEIWNENQS